MKEINKKWGLSGTWIGKKEVLRILEKETDWYLHHKDGSEEFISIQEFQRRSPKFRVHVNRLGTLMYFGKTFYVKHSR